MELNTLIENFNPAQKEAVSGLDGPCLIVAGAGSGKTSVLTARIALMLRKGIPAGSILALTFTKKAATEMKERIAGFCGKEEAKDLFMGTFHSVFARLLRRYAPLIAFPSNFTILDEDDSKTMLRESAKHVLGAGRPPEDQWSEDQRKVFEKEDAPYKVSTLAGIISSCKNHLVTPEAYRDDEDMTVRDKVAGRPLTGKIFTEYRNRCHRSAVMDYDDILLYTDMLLANNPQVCAELSTRFSHILVDEYQDTNAAQ